MPKFTSKTLSSNKLIFFLILYKFKYRYTSKFAAFEVRCFANSRFHFCWILLVNPLPIPRSSRFLFTFEVRGLTFHFERINRELRGIPVHNLKMKSLKSFFELNLNFHSVKNVSAIYNDCIIQFIQAWFSRVKPASS